MYEKYSDTYANLLVTCMSKNITILVTPNQAPRVDVLTVCPDLFQEYLKLFPNGKLPPKQHSASLLEEHHDHGPLFTCGFQAAQQHADVWAGHIRTVMAKYRDLVMYPNKLEVLKKQVLTCFSQSHTHTDIFSEMLHILAWWAHVLK